MADRKPLPGKFVWFELASTDPKKAQAFYREVLGWNVRRFPTDDSPYEMIFAGDTPESMVGGYAAPPKSGEPSHWISYVSVEDVDRTAEAAAAEGGRVIQAPFDIQGIGRVARIADPQGARLSLFKSDNGDPADMDHVPAGRWVWNELHTTDAKHAVSFYEKVLGYSHRAMDMGPGGTYYILSRDGVDRAGVTEHLPAGVPPHWLPYVHVDDPDATIARARKAGGTIPFGPDDIPGVGRIGGLTDPTGAVLAFIKPMPRTTQSEHARERETTLQGSR
jgi:hypothetical protein